MWTATLQKINDANINENSVKVDVVYQRDAEASFTRTYNIQKNIPDPIKYLRDVINRDILSFDKNKIDFSKITAIVSALQGSVGQDLLS